MQWFQLDRHRHRCMSLVGDYRLSYMRCTRTFWGQYMYHRHHRKPNNHRANHHKYFRYKYSFLPHSVSKWPQPCTGYTSRPHFLCTTYKVRCYTLNIDSRLPLCNCRRHWVFLSMYYKNLQTSYLRYKCLVLEVEYCRWYLLFPFHLFLN